MLGIGLYDIPEIFYQLFDPALFAARDLFLFLVFFFPPEEANEEEEYLVWCIILAEFNT